MSFAASHLQNGVAQSKLEVFLNPISLRIFQVLYPDFIEKRSFERS
jgi:hypothetical protein